MRIQIAIVGAMAGCAAGRSPIAPADGCPDCGGDARPTSDAAALPACWSTERVDDNDHTHAFILDVRSSPGGELEAAYPLQWDRQRTASLGSNGAWAFADIEDTTIAVDAHAFGAAGAEHICYHDWSEFPGTDNPRVHFGCAARSAAGWTKEIVDPAPDAEQSYTAIAVAPDGMPHVAYHNGRAGEGEDYWLFHAWRTSGGWVREPLGASFGAAPIAVDEDGCVHIVRAVEGDAAWTIEQLAKCPGGEWSAETIDQPTGRPELSAGAITFDPEAQPTLAYVVDHDGARELRLAVRTSAGVWAVDVLDAGPAVMGGEDLAVAADGAVYVTYLVRTDVSTALTARRLVELTPARAIERAELGATPYGALTGLALDRDGSPHAVFIDDDVIYPEGRLISRVDHVQPCAGAPTR